MRNLYPDAIEQLPHNMPEVRGVPVDINVFVEGVDIFKIRFSKLVIFVRTNFEMVSTYICRFLVEYDIFRTK